MFCPVFSRPHSEANHGSRAAAWRSRFGSAQTTSASARRSASASARSPGAADTTSTSLSGRVRSNRTSAPGADVRPLGGAQARLALHDDLVRRRGGRHGRQRRGAQSGRDEGGEQAGERVAWANVRQRTVIWCIAAASVWTGVRPRRPPARPEAPPLVARSHHPARRRRPAQRVVYGPSTPRGSPSRRPRGRAGCGGPRRPRAGRARGRSRSAASSRAAARARSLT